MTKMIKTKVNGRWDILLPEHRAVRPEWASKDGWEKKRLDHLHDNLKFSQGDTIYYIGAEEGDMAALCQMWGAKVVLFEPNPLVWPNIKAIWDANGLEEPYVFNGFAANKTEPLSETLNFGLGFPESADGDIISDHGFKNLCEADGTIAMVKIDDLVMETRLVPNIISVDVEGAEYEVLRGAKQTLEEYHPRIYLSLHPEFMYEIYGEYATDLRNWIKGLGYKETLIDYQHEVHLFYEENK